MVLLGLLLFINGLETQSPASLVSTWEDGKLLYRL